MMTSKFGERMKDAYRWTVTQIMNLLMEIEWYQFCEISVEPHKGSFIFIMHILKSDMYVLF